MQTRNQITPEDLGLTGKVGSKKLLKQLARAVATEQEYTPDSKDVFDDWSYDIDNFIEAIKTDGKVTVSNDCDGMRAMVTVLLRLGWPPENLCEMVVDTNNDGIEDHYISGAFVDKEWYCFDCWQYGRIEGLSDKIRHGYKVIKHSLVSDGRRWYAGLPPKGKD